MRLIIKNSFKLYFDTLSVHKSWSEPEHVGKVTISILNVLSREFHKEAVKDEPDHDLLVKLSSACGYQSQLYSGLQKNHEFAKRLQSIEKTIGTATAEELALGKNPVLSVEADTKSQLDGR